MIWIHDTGVGLPVFGRIIQAYRVANSWITRCISRIRVVYHRRLWGYLGHGYGDHTFYDDFCPFLFAHVKTRNRTGA